MKAHANLRRLGLLASIAAGFLAWRTFQERSLTAPLPPVSAYEPDDWARVLDRELDGESRRQALLRLIQQGPAALPALRDIVLTPIADDPVTSKFEVSLRIGALGALDDLAERGVDVGDVFQKAAEMHRDPALEKLAMAGLKGQAERTPKK